ncbi:PSD1 and planctomycete cytochrome C domain-containing protein [Roseimaritima ulvae]|uniref:PSD1 and planctomycete cytochrome C domain-containing protein n=1 Tax=Roseimaritima ulvae TaxID=980254 RepID=UPI0013900E26|nr:PSD1 and planctomycete cytochrome C domain-containing protein [Roseimaritima ulvae]
MAGILAFSAPAVAKEAVDFNRDIRPLLSDRCFHCHGPDSESREGGFRFDMRDSAIGEADSGQRPITPTDPATSEMLRRLVTEDAAERMPPEGSNKERLTDQQIQMIRDWIAQGAPYEKHWAFIPPRRSAIPDVKQTDWPQTSIDRFLLASMEQRGLSPSAPAERAMLLRRVSFDLTGLPPTPEDLQAFQADQSPDAYQKVVDRLLQSPQFGEKMASTWLDAARYADTNGYLQNGYRVSWPWRDWLVQSWNQNLSYDRFVTELLAGDLVDDATDATRLATCFLRMHMITSEGGSLDEEFRVEYAADRAETVGTVFMGLTMNCCRCHDHKFDPFPQQEYYQLFALFADPQGEDPVKDHSRDPAFVPFVKLDQTNYAGEAARLGQCVREASQRNNENAAARLTLQKDMLTSGLPVMVMKENPAPRQNFVLQRGAYQNPDKNRPVQPGGVDAVLQWKDELPRNRLGFAQWLTDPEHPLTARVEVNRIWTTLFGRGLVDTQEDFGQQGSYPTHPELLDYLAVEFRESGWDRKALMRRIVLSAAYQQSSQITPRHRELDPTNRWLARVERRRLSAEAIRDQALFVSGLLNAQLGGFAAMPYQPSKLWIEGANSPGYGRGKYVLTSIYEPSSSSELYRRSIYTFWNRNAPPPQMVIFDAPGRSFSSVSRTVTNTPLQALVTMNDTQFFEAARVLAERVLADEDLTDDRAKLANIMRRCTGRLLTAENEAMLLDALNTWRKQYQAEPQRAERLLAAAGQHPHDPKGNASECAAWTMIATTVLNFDATLVVN